MDKKALFRKEALEARKEARNLYGDVLLFLPRSYKKILALLCVCLLSLLLALIFGSYTRRVAVKGELFSTLGAIPVYLPKPGIINKYFVKEDEVVEKGAPLFLVSTEVFGLENRGISTEAINLLDERKKLLRRQLESEKATYVHNLKNIEYQIHSKQSELKLIGVQIKEARQKNALLSASSKRYEAARAQEAISEDAMAEKTISTLNSRIDYNERQRSSETLSRDIANLVFERDKEESEFGKRTLSIKGELLALEEQILAAEYQKGAVIKSPAAGKVTAVQGVDGSYYDSTKPVSFVVPSQAEVEARLLVPAAAIGFVKKGDVVYLRYSAFPYQQFGQGKGVIYSISETSLMPDEIALGSRLSVTEPMYLVKARIERQFVSGNGMRYALKPGLTIDADVMVEQHRIYQWLMRPIFAASERISQ
ncbi:HlyD family efflux transporter periplasmic adaptor subunit [Burkholderia sp. JSH-S8]|uniref:HlyD family efflux transporter periplasmic adaptor subunit n=1 Tax=Burkholderia stagnalis TaxID=1503054 RepID=UPI000F813F1C|nr:HlyD family efflux transporter periplasmic adaptor subunit [Burkholderia stagnalis]WGS44625.1 HlyD family efflux transporter periplasmic adaptor subunit [Burkholderia sp. JSH-S8]